VSREVIVCAYDPEWPTSYRESAAAIRARLGASLLGLEHVGSTAVSGLAAKPIIDLLAEVAELEEVEAQFAELAHAGWEPAANRLDLRHLPLVRREDERRTHHLHCVARGSSHFRRMLAFRDYLRAHPAVAEEYGALKRTLAAAHPRDIDAYMRGKDGFVKRHEAEALRWAPT
jgi:GrpB-like predicted nucleotidyltransferase (UPF0157 family)